MGISAKETPNVCDSNQIMKPPKFEYFAPETLAEATALLAEHGDDAKILAGGQSLMPMLNMRMVRPQVLVDLNGVADLGGVEQHLGGGLTIGALTRQRELERSPVVREAAPVISAAMPYLGHVQIRNRGTIGGSLSHADPAAELPALCTALDAQFVLTSSSGERTVPARDFFVTALTTALEAQEILTQVRIPPPVDGSSWGFYEVCRREGDFALAGAVCMVHLDASGTCQDARIILFGVGGAPVRADAGAGALIGTKPDAASLQKAADAVSQELEPPGDIHASAQYRKEVGGVVVRRALAQALEGRSQ